MTESRYPAEYPIQVVIPTLFWRDHFDRAENDTAEVVKAGERLTTVILDEAAWANLYSDADYYASQDNDVWAGDYRGLINSARTTLKRMTAAASAQ